MTWLKTSFTDQTIDGRYKSLGTFSTGFDYLRIVLACAIVVQHSYITSYGPVYGADMWGSNARIVLAALLPMFFALSGFLVSGSLKKSGSLKSFFVLRAVRIVPALTVEVMLSSLVLGPLLTTLTVGEYFTSRQTYAYFANCVGWIHYILPGLFADLPFPNVVNASLWTVPYELECYLALMILSLIGIIRRRALFAVITLICICVGTYFSYASFDPELQQSVPLPRALVVSFLVGVTMNLYSDIVPLKKVLAVASILALVLCGLSYQTVYLSVIPAAYLCVYIGMMNPPKVGPLFSGDYSYGLYLFAFPIQQAYSQIFTDHRVWYLNAIFTLVTGFAYAAFSWWCVEKPVLSRKSVIVSWFDNITGGRRTAPISRTAAN